MGVTVPSSLEHYLCMCNITSIIFLFTSSIVTTSLVVFMDKDGSGRCGSRPTDSNDGSDLSCKSRRNVIILHTAHSTHTYARFNSPWILLFHFIFLLHSFLFLYFFVCLFATIVVSTFVSTFVGSPAPLPLPLPIHSFVMWITSHHHRHCHFHRRPEKRSSANAAIKVPPAAIIIILLIIMQVTKRHAQLYKNIKTIKRRKR